MRKLAMSVLTVVCLILVYTDARLSQRAQAAVAPGGGGCITQAANGVYTNNCLNGLQAYTVAALPACNTTVTRGLLVWVTDAQSPTYGGALTGGGSTPALAFCGGATWNAH